MIKRCLNCCISVTISIFPDTTTAFTDKCISVLSSTYCVEIVWIWRFKRLRFLCFPRRSKQTLRTEVGLLSILLMSTCENRTLYFVSLLRPNNVCCIMYRPTWHISFSYRTECVYLTDFMSVFTCYAALTVIYVLTTTYKIEIIVYRLNTVRYISATFHIRSVGHSIT